jgi:hypothetical protein
MNLDLSVFDNDYVATGLALFLGLYAIALSRMELPPFVRELFNNSIFRVVFLTLLLTQNFDNAPHVALTVALIFVVTLHYINEQEVEEELAYFETYSEIARN